MMREHVFVKGYAKINLALDVLHKRPDGYHEVSMIMQSISLADDIKLTLTENEISIATNSPELSCDNTNLAYKAAALLRSTFNITKGVHIDITKNIPIAAGLAGGSTDAAAVLKGLRTLWNLDVSLDQLATLGAQLGSDVPFCIYGGTMLATGRGEILSSLPDMPECYIVLAKPLVAVSTAWVYKNYNVANAKRHPDIKTLIKWLEKPNLMELCIHTANVLESVTISKYPIIQELKDHMTNQGALLSLMSGSGPTVFGLFSDKKQAEKLVNSLNHFKNVQVFVTKILKVGEKDATSITTC